MFCIVLSSNCVIKMQKRNFNKFDIINNKVIINTTEKISNQL